ncbi:hypothetical protein [Formosa sp. L2A11]|uniref:hypothetical protein n=1 Tax=Formosa sp. L2A11 TaxID=2686363 RepID=UPI00131AB98A|nr:hypothetical protein [Formosa sp. L2A11]
MKKIANIFLIILSSTLLLNCDDDQFESSLDYVTFSDATYQSSVDPGSTATKEITVYSTTISSTDRVFDIVVDLDLTTADADSYEVPTTVTIPANSNAGVFTVNLADVNLDCFNDLGLKLMPYEGVNPGNSSTLTFYQKPSDTCELEVSGTIDFTFDSYASEISYEILDVEGNVVTSGPSEAFADGTASFSAPVTLCDGRCYSLVVYDAYGDGLVSPGAFTLTLNDTEYASGGGDFGDSTSTSFQVFD